MRCVWECWKEKDKRLSIWGKNENEDMVLEDNYFDMNAGEKRIRIISGEPVGLKVRSVYDI